jgi:ATP-dependent exoDNAse (exonuclease V) beta subunit
VADLVCVGSDRVRIVDYKTDLSDHAESEYRKQLSVYYHVVREVYPDRAVSAELFYTSEGECVEIDPLPIEALREVVERSQADSAGE